MMSQLIQEIFLDSSLKKKIKKKFKGSNDICRSLEEGNEVDRKRRHNRLQ